jgi:hypothetical protein
MSTARRTARATENPIDQSVRDAIADLQRFWTDAHPRFYDRPFPPLKGGYFAVDSTAIDRSVCPPTGIGCPEKPMDPQEGGGPCDVGI